MVIRQKRLTPRHDGDKDIEDMGSEPVRVQRKSDIVTRGRLFRRMGTRSDVVVEKSQSVGERRRSSTTSRVRNETEGGATSWGERNGRQSESSPELEKIGSVEIRGMKKTKANAPRTDTPLQSASGRAGDFGPKSALVIGPLAGVFRQNS